MEIVDQRWIIWFQEFEPKEEYIIREIESIGEWISFGSIWIHLTLGIIKSNSWREPAEPRAFHRLVGSQATTGVGHGRYGHDKLTDKWEASVSIDSRWKFNKPTHFQVGNTFRPRWNANDDEWVKWLKMKEETGLKQKVYYSLEINHCELRAHCTL